MKSILAVVGTTGVGKSKLALQLASSLNGEIVNIDSMQVYKGLDIITNKSSVEERKSVKHHLIDFVDADKEYSAPQFQLDALECIENILARNKLPILVGGTHYYLQSVLWHQQLLAVEDGTSHDKVNEQLMKENPSLCQSITESIKNFDKDAKNTSPMYTWLQKVDPKMALRWHPKDGRKIKRSLQVYLSTGKLHSEHIAEQSNELLTRYKARIYWPFAELSLLYPRLDTRVDHMIQMGLFKEIQEQRQQLDNAQELDYTRGILQAIGFKEFKPYLDALEGAEVADSALLEKLKTQGLDEMKTRTRQYAKRQVTWIRNRLLPMMDDNAVKCTQLDANDLSQWDEQVFDKALSDARDFLQGKENETLASPKTLEKKVLNWKKYTCHTCIDRETGEPRTFNGDHEWNTHIQSKAHAKQEQRAARPRHPLEILKKSKTGT